jgi:hypothetical protein
MLGVLGGGGENPQRTEGGDTERSPRPLGLSAGTSWQPREQSRSFAMHELTHEFLEHLEFAPWLQDVAVAAMNWFSKPFTKDDSKPGADVPDEPGSWKFAAIGDYGAGTEHLKNVAANIARSGASLVITAGDNTYPTGRWQDYQKNWEPFMGPVARSRKFMPALGNHDMYRDDLRPYFAHFPHLKGLAYYTFVEKDTQFYAIDSDQDLRPGSAQLAWLEEQLKRSKSKWKVVYMHYPMYGSTDHDYPEISDNVQPLLEKYGVQLAVVGHEHNYIRSKAQNGVVHVLTGGGGQRVYPFLEKQAPHIAYRAAAYHHLEVSVGAHTMVVRAIGEDGKVFDTVSIPVDSVAQARRGAALVQ